MDSSKAAIDGTVLRCFLIQKRECHDVSRRPNNHRFSAHRLFYPPFLPLFLGPVLRGNTDRSCLQSLCQIVPRPAACLKSAVGCRKEPPFQSFFCAILFPTFAVCSCFNFGFFSAGLRHFQHIMSSAIRSPRKKVQSDTNDQVR